MSFDPSATRVATRRLAAVTPIRHDGLGTPSGSHLVALDIDGTIVHHDGSMSRTVRDGVRRVAAAGHDVVIATGRSWLSARTVIAELGVRRGFAVCSNGAVIVALDPALPGGACILARHTFDPASALTALRAAWPEAHVAVEEVGVGYRVHTPFPPGELEGEIRVVDWEQLIDGPATRVIFRSPNGTAQDFLDLAARIGLHGVNYSVGFTAWLDIAPEGVSKASGLEKVRGFLRIDPSHTLAVGDQRNDVEMLQWAACGVAMGNAPDEVRAVADWVTGHVDDDGLVDVLRLLPDAGPACVPLLSREQVA